MTEKKRPTPARVARVRRLVNEALDALGELEGSRATSVSAPLCSVDAALKRWIDAMAIDAMGGAR